MAKSNIKKIKNNNSALSERHFGVILESMDSKLNLVVEGHQVLDKKIEDFRKETNNRFNEMDYKFDIVFDELHLIRNDLKEKVGRDEFVLLEKRVMALERAKR